MLLIFENFCRLMYTKADVENPRQDNQDLPAPPPPSCSPFPHAPTRAEEDGGSHDTHTSLHDKPHDTFLNENSHSDDAHGTLPQESAAGGEQSAGAVVPFHHRTHAQRSRGGGRGGGQGGGDGDLDFHSSQQQAAFAHESGVREGGWMCWMRNFFLAQNALGRVVLELVWSVSLSKCPFHIDDR